MSGARANALPARLAVALAGALLAAGCRSAESPAASAPAGFRFEEAAAAAGLDFTHLIGHGRPLDILRTTGSGLAWLDYDGDGWPDLFCVNGSPAEARGDPRAGHRLYRNRGDGTFEDVTERAGVRGLGQDGMGAAVGDYDGDGRPDLYVTCYGPNRLYRNRGDGTFEEVAARAGVAGPAPPGGSPAFNTAAAFFDADGDGDLDLYVTRYCDFGPGSRRFCLFSGTRSGCPPTEYSPQPDLFFRNDGRGRFALDPSRFSPGDRLPGRGLGVLPFDADGDGRVDLFVANDGGGNFFFRNEGSRHREASYACGLALDALGRDPASMGLDAADYDRDGRPDLAIGNFQERENVLYRQEAPLRFRDASAPAGVAGPTRDTLTFGTGFADFDLDGQPELLFINGHVQDNIQAIKNGVTWMQPAVLLRLTNGVFTDVTRAAGPALLQPIVGRGLALADYDRDGDEDAAVSVNGGGVRLWRNDLPRRRSLRVELRGRPPNTGAIGARVSVRVGQWTQQRQLLTGRGYLSDSERPLTFGLGSAAGPAEVEVRWPDGGRQSVTVASERVVTIVQQ